LFHHLGAYGIDITSEPDNAAKDADYLSKRLLENGVTGFCLTIVSAKDGYSKVSSHTIPFIVSINFPT